MINIDKILKKIIICWCNGELRYLSENIEGTYDDFLRFNKNWNKANYVISNINQYGDNLRSDYFDPFILDKHSIIDIPLNEKFKWIIKNNNIWIMMIDKEYNIACDFEIPILYANKDKNLHILLNKFTNILFELYKYYILSKNYTNILEKFKEKYNELKIYLSNNE